MQWCQSDNVLLEKILAGVAAITPAASATDFPVLLSVGIEVADWLRSLRHQPRLFIRVRKNRDRVFRLLENQGLDYRREPTSENEQRGADCLSLKNGAAIDKILPEEDYVVQDWASQASIQKALSLMQEHAFSPQQVWDVCSGAGGKSILLKDTLPAFRLLATDIRESILHNLKMRFRTYSLTGFETKIMDGTSAQDMAQQLVGRQFDAIICDVPCSGSGTWARTPEQFHFFDPAQLGKFEALQYPIAFNAQHYLAPGGFLVYITCSVFGAENEAVVERLLRHTTLNLIYSGIVDGMEKEADSMFVAVFRK